MFRIPAEPATVAHRRYTIRALDRARDIVLVEVLVHGEGPGRVGWPGRRRDSKEIEILLLRHELHILRRQHPRPRLEPRDRAWLALLSRMVSRERWSLFVVPPDTLLAWHRRMVRRR